MSESIWVAVAASIPAVRAGLRALIQSEDQKVGSSIEVAWEAASPAELLDLPADLDVLILTRDLVEWDGPFSLEEIFHNQEGEIALLLLTGEPVDPQQLVRLPLRAWGILSLDASANELRSAVRALQAGLCVGSPDLIQPLLAGRQLAGREELDPMIEHLTEREGQVLQLLAQGLANKQIAFTLGISEHTVKFHISALFSKLGVNSRTEAIRLGVQRGLVVL